MIERGGRPGGKDRCQCPEIEITVRSELRNVDFAREDVDLGIRYGKGIYPGLDTRPPLTERVFPVCAPSVLAGERPLRKLDDLRHHTLLHDRQLSSDEPSLYWRTWLRDFGVEVPTTQGAPILIVPVWRQPPESKLWEDNPWRKAWLDLKAEQGLLPLIVPVGDVRSRVTMFVADPVFGDKKSEPKTWRKVTRSIKLPAAPDLGAGGGEP